MTALREIKKVEDGMVHIKIPSDFESDEVEVIVMPKVTPMSELDPYFEKRKKHIAKAIEELENGKMKVYSEEEFEKDMDEFEKELVLKYDN